MITRDPATGDVLPISGVDVAAYTIPTATDHESDGTLAWDSTTMVVAHVHAGDVTGMGFTYGHEATASVISDKLTSVIEGHDAFDIRSRWLDMFGALRNAGRPGIGSHAISALDIALWDLKARALDLPLVDLMGAARERVLLYGSGGFCNYTIEHLQEQLRGWVDAGFQGVKLKVGRHPDEDNARVAAAREAIDANTQLMVDANGAYTVQEALRHSAVFAEFGVVWHEEPVSSDDLRGLRDVRRAIPKGMDVAAGEYAYDVFHVRNLIDNDAVDCMQADVTRIGGFTGFLDAAAVCFANNIDLSAHTAPRLSVHPCAAAPNIRHIEYFFDHDRIEHLLFDGVVDPDDDGMLAPDRSRPGHGLELKRSEAERFAA